MYRVTNLLPNRLWKDSVTGTTVGGGQTVDLPDEVVERSSRFMRANSKRPQKLLVVKLPDEPKKTSKKTSKKADTGKEN